MGIDDRASELERRRDRGLEILTQAFAKDRLSVEEYERRAGLLQKARDPNELEAVLADLPAPAPTGREPLPYASGREAAATGEGAPALRVDSALSGSQTLACVMGERHLQGDWLNGDRVESFTLMGSTKIDLRQTSLPGGPLRIDAFALMGETKIIVPRNLPVRMNAFPFMGETRCAREVSQRIEADRPYVVVEGMALMGSIVVVAQD